MNKSESIKEIAIALHQAQSEMRSAKKGSDNPFFKSSYADLSEIIQVSKEPLHNNGLSFIQFPLSKEMVGDSRVITEKDNNKTNSFVSLVGVETILMHISGEWISGQSLLAVNKQDPQAYGSAITYSRRYALQSILGIPSEDDDGNSATFDNTKETKHSESGVCACGVHIKGNYKKCYDCNQNGSSYKDIVNDESVDIHGN